MGVFAEIEAEFEYEIVEEFFSHFSFMTESMERLVVGLADESKYSNNINELFRICHNIKSATGYLKIEPINKLVTLAEEVLEECRLVDGSGSDALINWLIMVSDQLNSYKEDLEKDRESFSILNHLIIKVPTEFTR